VGATTTVPSGEKLILKEKKTLKGGISTKRRGRLRKRGTHMGGIGGQNYPFGKNHVYILRTMRKREEAGWWH